MKKNTIKAFTLVEMLIVIVIIGILIASLMPRMQSAQGRARDVARKNDLSQIQTAIITSQQDKRNWPNNFSTTAEADKATLGQPISKIAGDLEDAGMTQVPTDPNKSNKFKGLGSTEVTNGNYGYMVTTRNSVANGGFVLMAKTEVEGSSNWIVCDNTDPVAAGDGKPSTDKANLLKSKGVFSVGVDLKDVHTCTSFVKDTAATPACAMANGVCTYDNESELRYILVY